MVTPVSPADTSFILSIPLRDSSTITADMTSPLPVQDKGIHTLTNLYKYDTYLASDVSFSCRSADENPTSCTALSPDSSLMTFPSNWPFPLPAPFPLASVFLNSSFSACASSSFLLYFSLTFWSSLSMAVMFVWGRVGLFVLVSASCFSSFWTRSSYWNYNNVERHVYT